MRLPPVSGLLHRLLTVYQEEKSALIGPTLMSLKSRRQLRSKTDVLTPILVVHAANWPEQRGTPAYRPIDTHLDHSRRPWANTVPETLFTITMIGLGVQAIGLANTLFSFPDVLSARLRASIDSSVTRHLTNFEASEIPDTLFPFSILFDLVLPIFLGIDQRYRQVAETGASWATEAYKI